MKQYGKFRKFRKSFRKTFRASRKNIFRTKSSKYRVKKFKRYFKRGVNAIAEKKTYALAGLEDLDDTFGHSLADEATTPLMNKEGLFFNIAKNLAEGTASNEKIGRKIFIRYITILGRVWCKYGADAANSYGATCKVSMQVIKDTRPRGFGELTSPSRSSLYGTSVTAFTPGMTYVEQPRYGYKFMKSQKKSLVYNPFASKTSITPKLEVYFKKRIKVMKELTTGAGSTSDWSIGGQKLDYYPFWVFDKQYTNLETVGPSTSYKAFVTYTDI